ncbi:efflux RND transporter permease subunit [Methylomicrobium sp. RS1]|jgi:multidrug efflux pump subunit AcrB|uniref:efflux RND transporter permease subunit n=1 Tax=Candidatus Methylomicrobium oryzae TaxID=2802053 RepID=UPI00192084FA|nr:efflux RND transporter permease subunit [Methylomicrobium sp. RS1]MBL1265585.1 efflux RND transporter permease subunit [Methylomicrobium sp. RS1]
MNVSAWCIRNPMPALMLFVLLSFGGILSFRLMKVQNMPDLDLPTVTVSASLPGASPSQLETEVARKIENAVATLQGLKHVTTKVQDGSVTITAEFRLEKPVQEALDDVRSAVSKVRADLPGDLRDPVVTKLDVAGSPILAFTVASSQRDDEALSWFVEDTVAKKLLTVAGVGQVNRVGGVSREVTIALDPVKLQALGATAADISRQLREIQRESAGGRANLGSGEQPVRTLANVASVEEMRPLPIALADGRRIRLDQVAAVDDTVAEPRSLAMLNGKPVVAFEVTRSRGASDVEVGAGVQKALTELRAAHPDIEFTEAFDFVTPAREEFRGSMTMLYEGALLAVLVVWLFLKDWRATFVSAVALPLSIIPAFWGMNYFGFSLNGVTLLALSLVVGILVDDAIVEVENIVRHLRMGKTPYQAAMQAADEIGLAVVATTFALVAVFLPTAFMSGIAGRFFKQFGWTAALAVLASLVVARMLTPMMAAYLLKGRGHAEPSEGRLMRGYMKLAAWCLQHRPTTMIAAAAFFIGSLFLIPLLPQGFIPPDDIPQTQVFVELPPGASLVQTRAAAEAARHLVAGVPYVKSTYTTIGSGSAGSDPFAASQGSEVRKATLTILLANRQDRPVRKQAIEQDIRRALQDLPGVRTKVGLGGSGEKYILVLSGNDPQALSAAARNVERDLRTIPGLGSIASSAALVRPEIAVRTDFARAADLGVTTTAIAETLRIATLGDYDWSLPKLNLAQRQVPVVVKLAAGGRSDLSVLARLAVPSLKTGSGSVMVSQVASLELSSGPAVIDRYDRSRNINFEVELSGLPLGEVAEAVQNLPSIRNLPAGVKQINIGDAEMMAELFSSFGLAMLTGVLCIFIVLVLLFKEFLQPITILAALPLSFGGGFVALLLTGKAFSMPSLIGLVMLMGIATKNSILLVEYAIVARRDHGMSRPAALLDACRKRARPIVMTTIAMGAGMLPIAVGAGEADASFRSPMAVAVIGGLVTSTLLSLLVIPVAYTYLDDFKQWSKSLRKRSAGIKASSVAGSKCSS